MSHGCVGGSGVQLPAIGFQLIAGSGQFFRRNLFCFLLMAKVEILQKDSP